VSLREPSWWEFVLLGLAAFRVYRLIARDTVTEPIREAISYPDAAAVSLDDSADRIEVVGEGFPSLPKSWRVYLSTLLRCPWCMGFYVSVAWWIFWLVAPHAALWLATPWAIAAVVALLAKNLDS
jgi:hypothetical protein